MIRCCLILLLGSLFSLSLPAEQIRVAVAANFKPVLQTLADRFAADTGNTVSISSASTGVLYTQITNGAPYDLFLSADSLRPQKLEQEGYGIKGSRHVYAIGELVLWNNGAGKLTLSDLKHYPQRLAIANPAIAPYGLAAQQVLEHEGLWQKYQRRLVKGASVQQAWQFVASGNVELGMVAHSQLMAKKYQVADITLIPAALYEPIQQEMIVLKRTGQPVLAKQFSTFLLSAASQNYIASQGYKKAKN